MLGILLALLGGMMGLAGGGGSSKAAVPTAVPATPTDTLVTPGTDPDAGPDPDPMDVGGHDDHGSGDTDDKIADSDDSPGKDGFGNTPTDDTGGHSGGMDDTPTGGHGGHSGGMDDTPTGGHDGHDGGMDDTPTGGHDGHDGGMDDTPTGEHDGHDGGHGDDTVDLPKTAAEIKAFVKEVREAEDVHVHDHDSPLMAEHMMALNLVDTAEASHIAIGNGSWSDPSNWHNGEIPDDDATVVIPKGVHIEYDQESDARLFTVRVDGHLEFANDADSKMVVDTFVVAPNGTLTIGTEDAPVADDVNVEIVIANNGAIDTEWDPGLFSRGLISHGKTEIHGQMKDSHDKVTEDPMAGDKSVTFDGIPEGWEVGDKIVIAGTHYEGYQTDKNTKESVYHETEDEVRIITKIDGDQVFFDDPLVHDHDTPRDDLYTSVANYSRNITVKSENADDGEVYERGHVMMMHSDEVDIRYAAFEQLGRTDKSQDLHSNSGSSGEAAFDSNVAGRYGLHLHRTGVDDQENPTFLEGNAVYGSPGWGIVHHDSHAVLNNNATYDTYGAGFVAETGNETGSWTDNIAIDAQGVDWGGAKGIHKGAELNFGISGDGFWFTGRMVEASDNVAASVNHGYIYFHRVTNKEGGKMDFDAELFEFAEALSYNENAVVNETPILVFEDNEAFAARMGLHVIKSSPIQGHDIHSVFDGFTGWNVEDGVNLQYTAHYILKDFDLISVEKEAGSALKPDTGIGFGKNTFDITIVDSQVEGFKYGLDLKKGWSKNMKVADDTEHGYVVINTDVDDNSTGIRNVTDDDMILDSLSTANVQPSLEMDGPLSFNGTKISLSGTKTDSLGSRDFPSGPDDYSIAKDDVVSLLEENGYYTTPNGDAYMVLDIYFSDSLTGDIFTQSELVAFGKSVPLGVEGKTYEDAQFNGTLKLSELKSMVNDSTTMVHDASAAEARTIEDFAGTTDPDNAMDHAGHHANHASPDGMSKMHEGEAMMETLSSGQTALSETIPTDHVDEDADHQMMAMM